MNALTVGMLIDTLQSHGWVLVQQNKLPASTDKVQVLSKGDRVVTIAGRSTDAVSLRAASPILQMASENETRANA